MDKCVCEDRERSTYSKIPGIIGDDAKTCKRCDTCKRIASDAAAQEILRAAVEWVEEQRGQVWPY